MPTLLLWRLATFRHNLNRAIAALVLVALTAPWWARADSPTDDTGRCKHAVHVAVDASYVQRVIVVAKSGPVPEVEPARCGAWLVTGRPAFITWLCPAPTCVDYLADVLEERTRWQEAGVRGRAPRIGP